MKPFLVSFLLISYLVAGSYSTAQAKSAPPTDLNQQISLYLTFPESLQRTAHNASVTIRFRVAVDNRVEYVQVFRQNQRLNQELSQQLTGKQLQVSKADQGVLHTLRLRFVQE